MSTTKDHPKSGGDLQRGTLGSTRVKPIEPNDHANTTDPRMEQPGLSPGPEKIGAKPLNLAPMERGTTRG